jgi:hypothetical protein
MTFLRAWVSAAVVEVGPAPDVIGVEVGREEDVDGPELPLLRQGEEILLHLLPRAPRVDEHRVGDAPSLFLTSKGVAFPWPTSM